MLMLHISDIHFKSPDCLDAWTDPDSAIRTRMMRDLTAQVQILGPIDAILICGDIAYKAAPDEYHSALSWIQQLSQISGCSKERIFVVPGNHDVDRATIKSSISIKNAHHAIASTELAKREKKLREQLRDEATGQILLQAHAAYNAFAAPFGCQIWPAKPFWHQDIPLDGGVSLRLYGLTSTLLSGREGNDDKERDLYLCPLQTVLDPAPNVLNLVMVHHPIDWLSDGEQVDEALTTRAAFHLFGHKHKQRLVREHSYVRFASAAINPSRDEQPFDPGYNLIRLSVEGDGPGRQVRVKVRQRRMQDNPERFISIMTPQGGDTFESIISVPVEANLPLAAPFAAAGENNSKAEIMAIEVTEDAEAAMGEETARDLLYRFWNLASSQRREIATKLNLLKEGEINLPEPERYGRALIRAAEMQIIDKVAAEVAKLEDE
jgi:predicted phosphodiesterase